MTRVRAMRALLGGQFEEGERQAQEALTIGQQIQEPYALQDFWVQVGTLRREQGRFEELEQASEPSLRSTLGFLPGAARRPCCTSCCSRMSSAVPSLAMRSLATAPRLGTWASWLPRWPAGRQQRFTLRGRSQRMKGSVPSLIWRTLGMNMPACC